MKYITYTSFIVGCLIGSLLLIMLLFMPMCNAADWEQGNLIVTPSHGPSGTQVTVSVDIKNDVEPEFWNTYYGLEYKIVWNVRPADIIDPNLWGWQNPIGTAYIDNNGLLYGTATIPTGEASGTYNIYAAFQRSSDDTYHVYWWTTFTVEEEGDSNNDRDGDGYLDNLDAFPDDPTEWADYDNDSIGNNADPTPYGDSNNDGSDNTNKKTPGFELIFVLVAIVLFISFKRKKTKE